MRNDMVTARSDMELALIRRKSLAEGRLLARTWWQFCADLLDESKQSQLAGVLRRCASSDAHMNSLAKQ